MLAALADAPEPPLTIFTTMLTFTNNCQLIELLTIFDFNFLHTSPSVASPLCLPDSPMLHADA